MATTARQSKYWPEKLFLGDSLIDHSKEFEVASPFIFSGQTLKRGSRVDKASFTTRLLRQLYDQRKIVVAIAPLLPSPDAGLAVRHVGHGKFCVMQGEARISDPKDKAGAEADLAILTS